MMFLVTLVEKARSNQEVIQQELLFVTWRLPSFELTILCNQRRSITCLHIKIEIPWKSKQDTFEDSHFSVSSLSKTSSPLPVMSSIFFLYKQDRSPRFPSNTATLMISVALTHQRLMSKRTPAALNAHESKAPYAGSYLLIFKWLTGQEDDSSSPDTVNITVRKQWTTISFSFK